MNEEYGLAMSSPLAGLGITNPVLAAPMAGGPSTPGFVIEAVSLGKFPLSAREEFAEVERTGAH